MITKTNRIARIAVAAVLMLPMLFITSFARSGEDHTVELAFTKWTRQGVLFGRLDDAVGTFAVSDFSGSPPELEPPVNPITQIDVQYHVTFDGHSFTAQLEGHQNNRSQNGVLNGVIINGWREGAPVHAEYDVVDQGPLPAPRLVCPVRFCFVGTLRIMPDAQNN